MFVPADSGVDGTTSSTIKTRVKPLDAHQKKQHRSGSKKSLSWGDGVKATGRIFDDMDPSLDNNRKPRENNIPAFHETNQQPSPNRTATKKKSVKSLTARPTDNRPPLSNSASLATGRPQATIKPVGVDDNRSEESKSRRQQHKRGESHGTLISVLTTDSSSSAGKRDFLSSSSTTSALEDRLMNKLLSKAYNNRFKSIDQMSYSVSSAGSSSSRAFGGASSDSKDFIRSDDNSSFSAMEDDSLDHSEGGKDQGLNPQEKKFIRMYFKDLEEERSALMNQWSKEFTREQEADITLGRALQTVVSKLMDHIWKLLSYVEVFIANMPLTIGAVGLCWATQGVIWFKFMEENNESCTAVHFNSPECVNPEFPGCFVCDPTDTVYETVLTFHYFCNIVAFTCCLLFLAKCVIAWKVVADELSNPTTSTPCGIICITIICVAAGRGLIGEIVVLVTSIIHILLSLWFLYMAICKFRLWPDPGWFPNTVGIAYAAIKTWLYFPVVGLTIMGLCMIYLLTIFPIAVYRAYYNHKVAAPICFISLSAPSITMYAMTLMAQSRPSEEIMIESDREFAEYWTEMHREYYIPLQHGMMVLSLIGLASSLQCLWARWPQFRLKTFSPAHVAFVFPILSHANAVQAYRAGFNAFTTDPPDSLFHIILYSYWLTCLVAGTGLNWIFTYKYLTLLPRWTKLEEICFVSEEENNDNFLDNDKDTSPNPSMLQEWRSSMDDSISHRERVGIPHEIFRQSFTSPAVLHANEVGALMRVRRGTEDYEQYGPYVRTRNVSSLGFDLTLSNNELRQERAELLRWVAKNAPRTRKRTLSIPPMFQWRGGIGGASASASSSAGSGEAYGTFPKEKGRHQRSQTWGAWAV